VRYTDAPAVEAEIYIEAAPVAVWPLVADIELMAWLSDELQQVEWLGGASGAAVDNRFRGRNRNQHIGEWETMSQVVECDPPRAFAWAVIGGNLPVPPPEPCLDQPAATWRFTLSERGGGTVLRQRAQMGPASSGVTLVIARMPDTEEAIVSFRLGQFRNSIERNLSAIKEFAEGRGR
jgi:uncharacterized protein YndB with AHSA1/START domain